MNIQNIKKFDKGNVFKTFENTHKQFEQVFKEFRGIGLKNEYKDVNKVIVCGMGGSALGADFVRNVFYKYIKLPIFILNDYNLPSWVDNNTLVVISSYSGTTEEPMQCFRDAKKRNLKIFCTGSVAFEVGDTPNYSFDPKYNYANNPRFAVGYSIASILALFNELGILKFNFNEIKKSIGVFHKGKKVSEKITKNVSGKIPAIIASEHLFGNAHIFNNQINETGKNFASYFQLPEICHHQFEGLTFPKNLKNEIIYILINSNLYHKRNQKRYEIMKQILKKKGIKFIEINAIGKNVFEEAMYVLGVSSYASFYLAYINKIDPQPNPWVDYLKREINK